MVNTTSENIGSWSNRLESMDSNVNMDAASAPRLDINGLTSSDQGVTAGFRLDNEVPPELELNHAKLTALKINSASDTGPSIPQLLHLICNGNDESPTASKRGALQQLVEASCG
ncbi:hypothetical protein F0562_002348 [Nyssa sinensis]|uniref:Uncharacterized protein n=1 Tax=Nyssa sinensis TaxID=561372 RepID=A0A5J5C739_9ASTE|nr:hypothetical protein F0562_002348 [Nyssa sinensis]